MADQLGMGDQVQGSVSHGLTIFPLLIVVLACFVSFTDLIVFLLFFFVVAPLLQSYSNRRRAARQNRRRGKR